MAQIGKVPPAVIDSVRTAVSDDGKINRAEIKSMVSNAIGPELAKLSTEREVDQAVDSYKKFFSQQQFPDSGRFSSNAWQAVASKFSLGLPPVKISLFEEIDRVASEVKQKISDAANAEQALSKFDAKFAAPPPAAPQPGQVVGAGFELGNTKREVRTALSDDGKLDFNELRGIVDAVVADLSSSTTLVELDSRLQAVKSMLTGVGYEDGSERLLGRLTVMLREFPGNARTQLYRELDSQLAGLRYQLTNKANAQAALSKLDDE